MGRPGPRGPAVASLDPVPDHGTLNGPGPHANGTAQGTPPFTQDPTAALVRLASCGVAAAAVYLVGFTVPYGIAGGLEKPLLQFSRITGPSLGPTLAFVGAVAALFGLYAFSVRLCGRLEGSTPALGTVFGLGAASAIVLVWMYPVFSLDIFYYMSADRIWTVFHENPFVVPPLQGAHDPFFPYTSWGHYPLPYGPLWPRISAIASAFGGGEIARTLVAFKALAVAGYLLALPAVYWAVKGLSPGRALSGLCLFAWNPLVLLELAGGGHNDAIALVPAALALGLWVRRASPAGALALTASLLVKSTVLILLPGLAWASFLRAVRSRGLLRWAVLHLLPAAAFILVAWLPFLNRGGVPSSLQEADQYYQSITAVVMALVTPIDKYPFLRGLQLALGAIFAAVYVTQLKALSDEGPAATRALWRIVIAYFMVLSPFLSAWYMIWPIVLAAMLAEHRTAILTGILTASALGTYLVQFVLRPLTVPTVTWAEINALGWLVAFVPFLVGLWFLRARSPEPSRSLSAG